MPAAHSTPHSSPKTPLSRRLHSPLELSPLNTPASTSSLSFSPSHLTPPTTAMRNLSMSTPNLHAAMDEESHTWDSTSPDAPPPDIHDRRDRSTPAYSKTHAMKHFKSAFNSSKLLQQVMGFREPVPFDLPVQIKEDLEEKVMMGLGFLSEGDEEDETELGVIEEEEEDDDDEGSETECEDDKASVFASTTTLANSLAEQTFGQAAEGRLPHARSLQLLGGYGMSSPAPANPYTSYERHSALKHVKDDTVRGGEHDGTPRAPTALFPPAKVQQQSDLRASKSTRELPTQVPSYGIFPPYGFDLSKMPRDKTPAAMPRITVEAPSPPPRKSSASKKRHAPSHKDYGPLLARSRSPEKTTGLPTFKQDEDDHLWKIPFPGNTSGLMGTLLEWSITLKRIYEALPNLAWFRSISIFPRSIQPPTHAPIISLAFYDTSTTPHKEIRFLGPGDVARMHYNEIDVFTTPQDSQDNANTSTTDNPIGASTSFAPNIGRKADNTKTDHVVNHVRWAYILIQAHADTDADTHGSAPHVMIAWHKSCMTSHSECISTIFPDKTPSPTVPHVPAPAPKPRLKRFASLQNLTAGLPRPLRFNNNLRDMSSSSALPSVGAETERDLQQGEGEGAWTLRRHVLVMGKAGKLPLIEGHRVDVGKWMGWMEAVGRGQGKVVFWREM